MAAPAARSDSAKPKRSLLRFFVSRNPWIVPAISSVHGWLYRKLDGRFVAQAGGSQLMLLETTGRKSGEPRGTPLLYVADGDDFVVVASNGGTERVPAWWLNLQADPSGTVQCGRERFAVRGRQAGPDETARLWDILNASYAFFEDYQARTERTIPVVILERVAPS